MSSGSATLVHRVLDPERVPPDPKRLAEPVHVLGEPDLIDAAQHLKDAPQLAQRVPARLLDGDQRLVCLIGSLRHYMGGDAGLDIDR